LADRGPVLLPLSVRLVSGDVGERIITVSTPATTWEEIMADRYCRNCGHELAENNRFCTNCRAPAHQAGHIPTPESDTAAPPPPIQQARGTADSRQETVCAAPYWITFVVLAFLVFLMGDNGTLVGFAGVGVAAVRVVLYKWMSRAARTNPRDLAGSMTPRIE
jgi:hypothetical protein